VNGECSTNRCSKIFVCVYKILDPKPQGNESVGKLVTEGREGILKCILKVSCNGGAVCWMSVA
jgi:hypothetical protein